MDSASKKSVLVVDDTQENIDVLKTILSGEYNVKIATSGQLALKVAFSPKPPDLILLDVMMPDMDGYEVCRQLKADERTQRIPIIFVTAKSEIDDETSGFLLGAADYIIKPLSPSVVLARVRTHLALYERSRQLEALLQERTINLQMKSQELEKTRLEILRCLNIAAQYQGNEPGFQILRMANYVKILAMKAGLSESEAAKIMNASIKYEQGLAELTAWANNLVKEQENG